MLSLKDQDKKILLRSIRRGEAVAFLGAGASATSLNKNGNKVMQANALAAKLADMGGFEYQGEDLVTVLTAVLGAKVSRGQLDNLLREEYALCTPSSELKSLMRFSWHRMYTWNLDDTVENYSGGVQRTQVYNGMLDPVVPNENISFLQLVHLHGQALKPEHGYILTEQEYNEAREKGHEWYRQVATDYVEKTPIFIGSKLAEPILSAELDRARPNNQEGFGVAFLVTPDEFSPITTSSFMQRGIVVVKATLDQFVNFLQRELGKSSISPEETLIERGEFPKELFRKAALSRNDIPVAKYIRVISNGQDGLDLKRFYEEERRERARSFLEGEPPSWELVYSKIPVELNQIKPLYDQLEEAYETDARLLMVYGQAGSGKTTAIMQSVIKLHEEKGDFPLYEIGGDVPSLREAVSILVRMHPDEKVVVYLGAAFIFGDSLAEDVMSVAANRIIFVCDARTREWRTHIRRRLNGVNLRSFEFQRFEREDYQGLAEAIVRYVPAPRFHKLSRGAQIKEFDKSRSQLLIALKEATHSYRFKRVIRDEFNGLPCEDVKKLFLVVGVATIARSGISLGMAKEIYDSLHTRMSFLEAKSELEGIVLNDRDGRLIARHDIYVRHIVDNVSPIEWIKDILGGMLGGFSKFAVPVIKSVGKKDGALFKFLLNHNFLYDLFQKRGCEEDPVDIYKSFEVSFQRDGHFWLQYGQYLSAIGDLDNALPILEKSIQAFPENEYAAHALADMQLRVAYEADSWDEETIELVSDAVESLEKLHEGRVNQSDQYPIITLAERHVDVLVKHERIEHAKEVAKKYFRDIGRIEDASDELNQAREKLLRFIANDKIPGQPRRQKMEVGNRFKIEL